MKKETKFKLEKFHVAKLKNMKKIIGGNGTGTTDIDDNTVIPTTGTTNQDRDSSIRCTN